MELTNYAPAVPPTSKNSSQTHASYTETAFSLFAADFHARPSSSRRLYLTLWIFRRCVVFGAGPLSKVDKLCDCKDCASCTCTRSSVCPHIPIRTHDSLITHTRNPSRSAVPFLGNRIMHDVHKDFKTNVLPLVSWTALLIDVIDQELHRPLKSPTASALAPFVDFYEQKETETTLTT